MPDFVRSLGSFALGVLICAAGFDARAQDAARMTVAGTTISVGGGVQLLQLPDSRYTFFSSAGDGRALHKQRNDDFDDYGGAVNASIESQLGFWGGAPVTGVVSGFFANVEDSDRKSCASTSNADCMAESLVDRPNQPDSLTFNTISTKIDRDVDFWGVGAEARFGKGSEPVPDAGGYLFRLGYVGLGADVRGIDQDIGLRINTSSLSRPAARLDETLDTTYWGAFASIGGEYNILGYLGIGSGWGLRSLVSLRAGIYGADTDYRGRFTSVGPNSRLSLSDDQVAFIGGASFETRKQFGPRTSLSLLTDYEYYSYAPAMRYVDADRSGCSDSPSGPLVNCAGNVHRTQIVDDDAFAVRTTLRLNIGLGSAQLYEAPLK
jgi:hypothetical protein